MLVKDAVKQGINDDGWYELDEDDRYAVYVENGKVVRGIRPDRFGLVPTYPYTRYGYRSYTSVVGGCELKDLLSGKVMMM